MDGEDLSAKIGYFLTAVIILFAIINRMFILKFTLEWFLGMLFLFVLFIINLLLSSISHSKVSSHAIHVIPISLIAVLIFWHFSFINYFFASYSTDSIVMSHMGAELVLQGKNPYKESLIPYLERFKVTPPYTTPKMDGSITDIITYPAFNFLVFVPFLTIGINDLRHVLLFFHIATIVVIYFLTPRKMRPIVLIPMFIPPFLDFTPGAVTDIVWVFFFVLSIRFLHLHLKNRDQIIKNLFLSGIFLGLCISFKQIALLPLPFLLIRLWHETSTYDVFQKLRKLFFFCISIAFPLIILNIPFIVDSPHHWLGAVLAPFFPSGAPMVPYGFGLLLMTSFGVSIPKSFFTNLTLLVTIVTVTIYYLFYDRLPYGMWVFLMIIPFFWWRSLPNYFIYWIPLMVFDIAQNKRNGGLCLSGFLLKNRRKMVVLLLAFSIMLATFTYVHSISSPEVLSIKILNVTLIQEGGMDAINHINVTIQNNGYYSIIPRFGISWHYGASNLIYWNILNGPKVLFPGSIATYHISTEITEWFLKDGDVITIIVNDARNPNILKASHPIKVSISETKGIVNGYFKYWKFDYITLMRVPYKWILLTRGSTNDSFLVSESYHEGKHSLKLQVYQDGRKEQGISFGKIVKEEEWAHVGIIQKISSICQVSLYFFPTFNSTLGLTEAGIRISDGGSRHFVVLFSDIPEKKYSYQIYPNLEQFVLILPTKLNQWNYYIIDIIGNWTRPGWDLPEEMYIELYIAAHYTQPKSYMTYFANISSKAYEIYEKGRVERLEYLEDSVLVVADVPAELAERVRSASLEGSFRLLEQAQPQRGPS